MFNFLKPKETTPKEATLEEEKPSSFFNGEIKGVSRAEISYDSMYQTSVQKKPTAHGMTYDSACETSLTPSFDYAINPKIFQWYSSNAFVGYQTMAIIAQNGFISKACAIPAKDAVRKGWEIVCLEDKEIDTAVFSRIRELDKKFKVKQKLVNQSFFTKVFGIRIALFEVKSTDPKYYEKPFNIDGVKKGSYKGIKQIDPYWITPYPTGENLSDPTSLDFYEPSYWSVNGQKIHSSHLVITKGDEVADILKPTYSYGGLSLTQKVYQRLYASEKLADEVPKLALSKRLNIYKIPGISKVLTNITKFKEKMNEWVNLRDNYGIKFADKDVSIWLISSSLSANLMP